MAFVPGFTISNTITAALTKIERARGFLEVARLSEDWIAEMQRRALVLEQGIIPLEDYTTLCPKANRRTLQRDIKAMVEKGIYVQEGAGPAAHYRLRGKE